MFTYIAASNHYLKTVPDPPPEGPSCLRTQKITCTDHVEFLELGAGQGLREVVSLEERLNLNASLMLRRQCTLRLLDLAPELLNGTVVATDVLALLLLVKLDEVVHDTLVKVLTTCAIIIILTVNLSNQFPN